MGTLGFSLVGFVCLCMLLVPNILWMRAQKEPTKQRAEPPALAWLERIGQAGIVACALIFCDYDRVAWSPRYLLLASALLLLVLYDLWWLRYFRGARREADLYRPLLGLPLAAAVLPGAAFFLLGAFGAVVWMMLSSVLFAAGHIPIAYRHRNELRCESERDR